MSSWNYSWMARGVGRGGREEGGSVWRQEREVDNCFTRWRLQIIVSLSSLPWPADVHTAAAVQCIVLSSNIRPAAAQSAVACSEWPAEQRPYLALPCFLLLISTGQQQQHPAPEHQHSDQDRDELTRHYTALSALVTELFYVEAIENMNVIMHALFQ